jgi:hypothetical protein
MSFWRARRASDHPKVTRLARHFGRTGWSSTAFELSRGAEAGHWGASTERTLGIRDHG